jgi:hypothetical protein
LIPKKARDFKKATAEETGFSEELTSSLIDFYWTTIRKDLSALVHPNISIVNLGIFKIKHWKLDDTVAHYEQIIGRIEGNFYKHAMRIDINDKLDKIQRLKQLLKEDEERLNKKKALRENENIDKNMEQ